MERSQPSRDAATDHTRWSGHAQDQATHSTASFDPRRSRTDMDSWVEISSQPSSSSLSSAADEIVLTGLRIQRASHHHHDGPQQQQQRTRRRRRTMDATAAAASRLNIVRANSIGGTSSQEEYEESESESDRVMTSSGEGPMHGAEAFGSRTAAAAAGADTTAVVSDEEDDDHRTAINYPLNRGGSGFTPQPNAFSHPPAGGFLRTTSSPAPNSYFPSSSSRSPATARPTPRHSISETRRAGALGSHLPQNPLSPTFNAAAQHEEALRASLNGLLSVAAAARGHNKPIDLGAKRPVPGAIGGPLPRGSNRMDPASLRLLPESALPGASTALPSQPHEPTFHPTIRRHSITSTSTTSEAILHHAHDKRNKSLPPTTTTSGSSRNASRERRALKKARRDAAAAAANAATYPEDFAFISPTLLTWLVSAGVVVFVSALSFRAGYVLGRESGFAEGATFAAGGGAGLLGEGGGMLMDGGAMGEFGSDCAREAGRSGLGLKRSLARGVVMV